MARTVPAVAGGSSRAGLYRFGHVYGAAKSGLPCRKRQIFAAMHKTNVGAGLLAKAVGQSILMSTDTPSSRASPLPQGRLQSSSFFISPANAANGLCVALATFGVLREPSLKYCWSV